MSKKRLILRQSVLRICWMLEHFKDRPFTLFRLWTEMPSDYNVRAPNSLHSFLDHLTDLGVLTTSPLPRDHPESRLGLNPDGPAGGRTQYFYAFDLARTRRMLRNYPEIMAALDKLGVAAAPAELMKQPRTTLKVIPAASAPSQSSVDIQILPSGCEIVYGYGSGEDSHHLSLAEMLAVHAYVEGLRKGGIL